ncbi:MAG: putative membrane protein [Rhodoferax sp.]
MQFGALLAPVPISMPLEFVQYVVLASWRAVLLNPLPMAFWAALIMALTLLGLALALLGLVLVIPLLGHAR